jgi:hypothetical protein
LIPVVPTRRDGLSTDDAQEEWKRWKDNGWDPARLNQLVAILGERATAIPWTNELQNEWRERLGTSKEPSVAPVTEEVERARVDGYAMTGTVLARFAPKMAKTVVAVSHHRSLDDLKSAMPVRRADPSAGLPAATLLAVVGHELLVPEDPDRDDFQLLAEAAEVGGDAAYREKRKLLHLWQQEFLDSDNLTDARSIKQAVEHMSDLVRDLNAATGKSKVWKGFKTLFSFLRAGANAGKLIEPVGANALGATVSLGEFVLDGAAPSQPSDVATPVASLVLDAQERLNLSVTGRRRA